MGIINHIRIREEEKNYVNVTRARVKGLGAELDGRRNLAGELIRQRTKDKC